MGRPETDAARLAEVRSRFECGDLTVTAAAGLLGLSKHSFYRLRRRENWKGRRNGRARNPAPVYPTPQSTPTVNAEAALEEQIITAAAALGQSGSPGSEPNARALASLTKALAELRRLQTMSGTTGKASDGTSRRPSRDLAELRKDIARRLAELAPEGTPSSDPD
jgi:hypothetical protein